LKPGAFEAVGLSLRTNVESAGLIFQTVWGLFTRETSPKQLMGPVAIAQLSGESAQLGLIPLLSLMAAISLNLGLLNLMPIPILDGGHIFIMGLEGLARRDFSARIKEKMLLAGFVVLMMLMVTVIYNDLTRVTWIERLMPWR
jgi:regulator of sigma E protease